MSRPGHGAEQAGALVWRRGVGAVADGPGPSCGSGRSSLLEDWRLAACWDAEARAGLALRLCWHKGLVREGVGEVDSFGEAPLLKAAADSNRRGPGPPPGGGPRRASSATAAACPYAAARWSAPSPLAFNGWWRPRRRGRPGGPGPAKCKGLLRTRMQVCVCV